jgi:hypothetical protein
MKTEKELIESKAPTPETLEELSAYIQQLVEQDQDYGTCVFAMSLAATAAFNHVASKLGVTGFQASVADLDILRRTRRIKSPFILLKGEDMLYPQYDLKEKLSESMEDWSEWAQEEAIKKLEEDDERPEHRRACPAVRKHWMKLAGRSGESDTEAGKLND